VLVAAAKGIVVRGVDGALHATLVTGAVSRPRYSPELGVLWFVRAGHLEPLDLGRPRGDPVVIVDAMSPLPFDLTACDVCVRIDLRAATIGVERTPDPERAIQVDVKNAVRIAAASLRGTSIRRGPRTCSNTSSARPAGARRCTAMHWAGCSPA
jgi:hypothetical protein